MANLRLTSLCSPVKIIATLKLLRDGSYINSALGAMIMAGIELWVKQSPSPNAVEEGFLH